MELEEDRLSSLPKLFLHHILLRLSEKDRTRTSVLSKAWLDTWYTFPILSFRCNQMIGMSPQLMEDSVRKRKILEFGDYVKRRMLMFRDQSLAIKEFKLNMNGFLLSYMSKDVDNWLKLACECGVKVIKYSQQVREGQEQYHVLPISVIEAKSLTTLALDGFIKIDPTFINHSIKVFSLRVLSLWFVLLGDEHAINHLISLCPLLEYITLKSCYVVSLGGGTQELKSLSINGLQKLKRVYALQIPNVYIDSPSLETLCYYPNNLKIPCKIDFYRCKNLKELYLYSIYFSNMWVPDLFSKFPFLEILKLTNCEIHEMVNISSVRLKVLQLSHCSNLKEVKINAPNILSCGYNGFGVSKPTISFLRYSSQLEVNIHIMLDYEDLCNLREFLQNIEPNNVLTSLSLSILGWSNVEPLDLVALQVSSSPPRIKHLVINYVPLKEYLFSSLVNIILSSCCPETISLRFHSVLCGKPFTKFFYETLMRINEDECSCSSDDTKCWWHSLKDVKVTSSLKIDEKADFKTILESLPAFAPREWISFRLEF